MIGLKLHKYDLSLCNYVLGNIREHMDDEDFAVRAREQIQPGPLLDYIIEGLDPHREQEWLLLNDAELRDLATAFEEFDATWRGYEQLHSLHVDTMADVSDGLGKRMSSRWSDDCCHFADQLEYVPLSLSEGIEIVRQWVRGLRRLLQAMGKAEFLPCPEGSSPTPTCKKPRRKAPVARKGADDSPAPSVREVDAERKEGRDTEERLGRIEQKLETLVDRAVAKQFYEIEEFARLVEREPFTCREWARLGRIKAEKKGSGRGPHAGWTVSHEELLRYQQYGLLPDARKR